MPDEKKESPAVAAARAKLIEAKSKADGARAALVAEQESEEALLAKIELERQALEREAKRLEREREAEPIYRKACIEHGEHRVAKLRTVKGSAVFRPMSAIEVDDLDVRQEALKTGTEKTKVAMEAAIDTLLYPHADEFRGWLDEHPALAVDVFTARNRVQSGILEEERGKG